MLLLSDSYIMLINASAVRFGWARDGREMGERWAGGVRVSNLNDNYNEYLELPRIIASIFHEKHHDLKVQIAYV